VIGFGDPERVREFDQGAQKGAEVELAEAVDVIPRSGASCSSASTPPSQRETAAVSSP